MQDATGHTPVLPSLVIDLLDVQPGDVVLDGTVGLGGHAKLLGAAAGSDGFLLGLDVDTDNLALAREVLADLPGRVELRHCNFTEAKEALASAGRSGVDVLLVDLGVSSTQLDDPQRGFSFQRDGPLDMRMDPRLTVTAADLVNRMKERELADLLYYNAQEMASRRISRKICEVRRDRRITTTGKLVDAIASALRVNPLSRKSKIHPATRTFQALRMAVNQEMPALESLLKDAPDLLNVGGRIGVIAFHSVEDKQVKLDFRRRKAEGIYQIVTKKPVTADPQERLENPRSRSAKLRVAVRLADEDMSADMEM